MCPFEVKAKLWKIATTDHSQTPSPRASELGASAHSCPPPSVSLRPRVHQLALSPEQQSWQPAPRTPKTGSPWPWVSARTLGVEVVLGTQEGCALLGGRGGPLDLAEGGGVAA